MFGFINKRPKLKEYSVAVNLPPPIKGVEDVDQIRFMLNHVEELIRAEKHELACKYWQLIADECKIKAE